MQQLEFHYSKIRYEQERHANALELPIRALMEPMNPFAPTQPAPKKKPRNPLLLLQQNKTQKKRRKIYVPLQVVAIAPTPHTAKGRLQAKMIKLQKKM